MASSSTSTMASASTSTMTSASTSTMASASTSTMASSSIIIKKRKVESPITQRMVKVEVNDLCINPEVPQYFIRMYNNKEYSDTIFLVNQAQFYASSHLMFVACEVLASKVDEHFQICGKRELKIEPLKYESTFAVILKFIHGMEIKLSEQGIEVLCEALFLSEHLKLPNLVQQLKAYISKFDSFQIDTIVPLLNTAHKFQLKELYEKSKLFVYQNAYSCLRHCTFVDLNYLILIDLIKSDFFYMSEINILKGVLLWCSKKTYYSSTFTPSCTTNVNPSGTSNTNPSGTSGTNPSGTFNINPSGTYYIHPSNPSGAFYINPSGTFFVNSSGTFNINLSDSSNIDPSDNSNIDPSDNSSNIDPSDTSNIDPSDTSSNIDPSDTSNIDPSDTSNIDPSDTSNIDPSDTSNINPSGTSIINPSGTSNINTSSTSNIISSGTSNINPSGTSNINPSGTSIINPSSTSNNNPSGTSIINPSSTSNNNPSDTSVINPSGTSYTNLFASDMTGEMSSLYQENETEGFPKTLRERVGVSLLSHLRFQHISFLEMCNFFSTFEIDKRYKNFVFASKDASKNSGPRKEYVGEGLMKTYLEVSLKFTINWPDWCVMHESVEEWEIGGIKYQLCVTPSEYSAHWKLRMFIKCSSDELQDWEFKATCQIKMLSPTEYLDAPSLVIPLDGMFFSITLSAANPLVWFGNFHVHSTWCHGMNSDFKLHIQSTQFKHFRKN